MMWEQVGCLYTQQIVARNLKEKQKTKTKTNITLRKITKHNSKKDKKYANHQNRMRVKK